MKVDIIVPTLDPEQGTRTAQLGRLSSGMEDVLIRVIHDEEQEGFTKTVNRGLKQLRPGAIPCLLNDDVYGFQYAWLRILVGTLLSRPDYGIVAPSGNSASGPSNGMLGERGIKTLPMVPFWCVVIRPPLIEKLGLLDERFIHYSSDTWYCRRSRQLGYLVVWDRSVYLWHEHQGSGLIKEWRIHDRDVLVKLGRKAGQYYSPEVPGL